MNTLTTASPTGTAVLWPGGKGTAAAQGTFGAGTYTVEASFDNKVNWIPLKDREGVTLALTAEGIISFDVAACHIRDSLAGSTAATVESTILPNP